MLIYIDPPWPQPPLVRDFTQGIQNQWRMRRLALMPPSRKSNRIERNKNEYTVGPCAELLDWNDMRSVPASGETRRCPSLLRRRSVGEWTSQAMQALALAMAIALVWSLHACVAQRVGPQGRVRVLCMGDVGQVGRYNSYAIIQEDPAIEATFVLARSDKVLGGLDAAVRNMRVYMPRTRESLVENHDVMILSDCDNKVFKPEWISWMATGIESDGLGLLTLGSVVYKGATDFDWVSTALGAVLPVTVDPVNRFLNGVFYVTVLDRNEELMQALPWQKSPPLANLNNQIPRDGSGEWAGLEGMVQTYPLMTYWEVGNGATLSFATAFPAGTRSWANGWNLFPQAMMYLVYRVADKALPKDPYLFEQVMNEFIEFNQMRSVTESMLDWVEKFGGNPKDLRDELRSVNEIRGAAEEAYLQSAFEEALETMDEARAEHIRIRGEATKAKDEALLWVYVTEWCTLLATLMTSSYVVWTLMVRRRLYREAGISRLHLREE